MMSAEAQSHQRRRFLPFSGRVLFLTAVVLIVIAAIGFGWLLFQPSQDQGPAGGIGIGQPAPDFTLQDTTGQMVKLSSFRGHPVIMNFWASYCAPCRGETPLLEQFYQAHQAQGLVILGIDEGEPLETITQYQQEYQVTYPLLLDRTLQFNASTSYDPVPLPRSYFIDAQGTVRAVFTGALTPPQLQQEFQTIGRN